MLHYQPTNANWQYLCAFWLPTSPLFDIHLVAIGVRVVVFFGNAYLILTIKTLPKNQLQQSIPSLLCNSITSKLSIAKMPKLY
ncbi:hypothetical protein [Alloprevotella tannerae]|uniref:hypothetical protein n=1 Tax=Alloprevotella tannerae TaxID=76122 RepID=UPI001EDC5B6D|nr:hypothetical protein [Alloprevotella tannerae]